MRHFHYYLNRLFHLGGDIETPSCNVVQIPTPSPKGSPIRSNTPSFIDPLIIGRNQNHHSPLIGCRASSNSLISLESATSLFNTPPGLLENNADLIICEDTIVSVAIIYKDELDRNVLEALLHNATSQINQEQEKVQYVCDYYKSLVEVMSDENFEKHDVILVDSGIHDIPFNKMCEYLHDMYQNIPIIVLVCSRHENEVFEILGKSAKDFIVKPLRRIEVTTRIKMQIQIKKSQIATSILKDIYPSHIAARLLQESSYTSNSNENLKKHSMIETHESVSILFSDICGYTDLSSRTSCQDMMEMLDTMFSGFDDICKRHEVYKVETIGDAYMIISGHDGSDDHADRLVKVARDMLSSIKGLRLRGEPIRIRIGINSGSVKSGIVGKIRRRFCIFGDTVNVSSRMESTGLPGTIQVTAETYNMLSDKVKGLFIVQRVEKEIKGKGPMSTYILKGT